MNPLITDYFGAEQAIVDRLRAALPELKEIYTPFSIADMLEASQASPSAHVIYAGDKPQLDPAGRGSTNMVSQQWLVVLAVRSAKAQLQQTKEIRGQAGILVPKVLGALQGWAPVEWMRPLSRVGGPPAGYSSSFAYFPFMFEGRIIT